MQKHRRYNMKSNNLSCKKVAVVLIGVVFLWILWKAWTYNNHHYIPDQLTDTRKIPSILDDDSHNKFQEAFLEKIPDVSHTGGCDKSSGLCLADGTTLPAKGLFAHEKHFYLDGKPFRILSGSFHYFRVHPSAWGDRLLKMKAAGLNTVTTYIPWNLHETVKRSITFTGLWDLGSFIQTVHQVGLKLIIRPGPYICAEWEYGGLPSWLLRDPNMKIRTGYKPYLRHVEMYFDKLLPLLAQWQYSKGKGPIIAFQIENEFGSYGNYQKDPTYLKFLVDLHKKWNIEELLFTSDGAKHLTNGSIPGILETVNFHFNVSWALKTLKDFQPNKPLMSGEYWVGWFDHWSEIHHSFDTFELYAALSTIFKAGASINFYMFVGGTNWGFWNGANNEPFYKPTTTSYDYDAPISESGELKPKFHFIKKLIGDNRLGPLEWPAVPANPKSMKYASVVIKQSMTYQEMINLIDKKFHLTLPDVVTMEMLDIKYDSGQGYGWLLYRTTFTEGKFLQIHGTVRDRAQIILNGQVIRTLNLTDKDAAVNLNNLKHENHLDILVENLGRANYKTKLNEERKGIKGSVFIDQKKLTNWEHVPIEFLKTFCSDIRTTNKFKDFVPHTSPAIYRGVFSLQSDPQDTYLLMENWTKGIVLVNGFNLGRYWNIGPQQTLYIPASVMQKGLNDVIVFELHGGQPEIHFSDKHVFKTKTV